MVLIAMVLWSAHPATCMPIRTPLVDPDSIPSLQSTNGQARASHTWSMPQEATLNEEVAKTEQLELIIGSALTAYRLGSIIWRVLNVFRDMQNPLSDTPNVQADLSDLANGGNIDLDALTDQLQNILNSQPSATAPTESVAEAQRKYWPIVRDFLDNIFSPTDVPSKQPDTNAVAEDLENALNTQFLAAGYQPEYMARTQVWSSIRHFVEDLLGKSDGLCR